MNVRHYSITIVMNRNISVLLFISIKRTNYQGHDKIVTILLLINIFVFFTKYLIFSKKLS